MRLQDLLNDPMAMPTLSAPGRRLVEVINQEDKPIAATEVEEVLALIAADEFLTYRVLRHANAAFFGLFKATKNLTEAVAHLGFSRVCALALGAEVARSFSAMPREVVAQLVRYSLNTANLAYVVAMQVRDEQSTVHADTAFTMGMLHAVGQWAMHIAMPDTMQAMNATTSPLAVARAKAEFEALGYTYADVGAVWAHRAGFKPSLCRAVERHNNPFDGDFQGDLNGDGRAEGNEALAGVLHMAAWRARCAEIYIYYKGLVYTYPDSVGEVLGLDPDLLMDDFAGMLELA